MKELSIEEKAKRYDDLLVKLQEAKVDNSVCDDRYCCVIDDIVPELKESEDEKIRQELIAIYSVGARVNAKTGDILDRDIVDWLEKQGEQKQETNYPKFDFNDILALQCCMETVKKVQDDKDLYEKLKSLHSKLYDAYWSRKQGEQKSADKVEPKFKKD